jgi:hypothetical protein
MDQVGTGGVMNKARLEWVLSGLNQHALTVTEGHFLETAVGDFDRNQALTEKQEEKLENLYKEKSKLIPNKNPFSFKQSSPKKVRPRRPDVRVS